MSTEKMSADRVHPVLRKILDCDVYLTDKFVLWANQFLPFRSLKLHYKILEVSCHGVPWFSIWIAFTWLINAPWLTQLQVNMLLGLCFDIVFVCTLKAITRRRRPKANAPDAIAEYGPDKFSFPSGHASRAVFVTYIFTLVYPFPIFFIPPLLAWGTCVCVSRVLLNRHHILDVLCGLAVGLFNGWLVGMLWLNEDTCFWLMSFINDERVDGGDYHV